MKSVTGFVLLMACLCIWLISAPGLTDAEPHIGAAWPILRLVQDIPPDSLIPRRRVKRVKRGTIDPGYEDQSSTERGKVRFPVWDDAKGEPLLD
ncbi:uncharacterized protein LOC105221310 [Zeugodacus cucurbitae]|uniref:uncharacterized protein LOC105221310 n=1 Tax=Zeugodacus cucurbitae TaxID=28588 RepID=UPI000596A0ED|nr:uncharacterized protein LOC105221310 [Zeugodacus cucurbitae]